MYGIDLGIRKEFLKNKATFTFNINDVFNSRKRGTINDTENFYQDSYRRWDVRSFRATLTYKFGKADFQLFKKNGGNRDENEQEWHHRAAGVGLHEAHVEVDDRGQREISEPDERQAREVQAVLFEARTGGFRPGRL